MIGPHDKLTPSVKRLLIEFMAKRQVDRAKTKRELGEFGLAAAVAADIADGGLAKDGAGALADVNACLLAVRNAGEPNPFKDSTDEDIVAAILARLRTRRP